MDYNLVDIHCHSKLSYDAFDNLPDGVKYDVRKIFKDSKLKMIAITDHNLFIYDEYIKMCKEFKKEGIKCLAGAELTIDNVHWIFIMDDVKLNEDDIGTQLTSKLESLIGFKYLSDDINLLKTKSFNVKEIISLLNDLEINYIAIPHLDKDKGYFKSGKISDAELKLINSYIHHNIIYGFETKYQDEFFVKKIEKINDAIKTLQNENASQEKILKLMEQISNLEKIKPLKSAFVYGSDYHGIKDSNYKDIEENLIYIKSECTFEGLRFALLDYESRIFSNSRKEKYDKSTNKVLEHIRYSINGKEGYLHFGDGLNSFIGSRGTGKSYIIRTLLNDNENYADSDIAMQIKISGIKLKSESKERLFLNKETDVDYILQKDSGVKSETNIYALLSEAPYNIDKFVNKIRELSTKTTKKDDLKTMIKNMNDCIKSYLTVNKSKSKQSDYSLLQKYNDFYYKIGENYKIVEIFNKYISYSEQIINITNQEIDKLNNANADINKVIDFLNDTLKIKKYDYDNQKMLVVELKKLIDANNKKIIIDQKNKQRIEKTNIFVNSLLESISKSTTNEENNFRSIFDLVKGNIDELYDSMKTSKQNSEKIDFSVNPDDEEIIEIQKNNQTIILRIVNTLIFENVTITDNHEMLKNYKNLENNDLSFKYLFDNKYGSNYIEQIFEKKDGRITRGELNGYELLYPIIVPNISININNEMYDLSKLSPGQRSNILLDLILEQDSNKILIIDQPEDDLDNETIYTKIVQKIRNLKLRRQIIIVSHNANLVINGDSDRIFVCYIDDKKYNLLQGNMENTDKYDYVSINSPKLDDTILNIAVKILEGGRIALANRVKKIGYKDIFLKEDN